MRRLIFIFSLLHVILTGTMAAAMDPSIPEQLTNGDSEQKIVAMNQLAQQSPDEALIILQTLTDGNLYFADNKFVTVQGDTVRELIGDRVITPPPVNPENITVNNRVRKKVAGILAALNVLSPDRETRLKAAQDLSVNANYENLVILEKAMEKEQDTEIRKILLTARSKAALGAQDASIRKQAVEILRNDATSTTQQLLSGLLVKNGENWIEPDEEVRRTAEESLHAIENKLALSKRLGQIFTGFSLGSILLLISLGLAITYGVMGVINMAHGELLMVGAYATYGIQHLFRMYFPQLIDWYLPAAIPCAFLAAACTGIVMERLVIRHLYGRPLETLLATWGISLFLIQTIRTFFGAQNVEVANPTWMSGGIALMSNLVLPWNRIIIIGFAMAVLFGMWAILNLTRLGLFVRAVTQNRAMSGCVGVPTGMVDTLAFGLGAGVAGLGGVALSQVSNVGPDMGQSYIVDSFMVVVLGGVGQLAGAVWAAMGLGVAGKFLEGLTGAVVAKIIVLTIIIIFIQKRPQGLFALKGRTLEP
jgi:urea transport system permease protein